MQKSVFLEYPIYTIDVKKDEIKGAKIDDIVSGLQAKVQSHPIATLINIFDHFDHLKNIGGKKADEIKGAKSVIFCFGANIPNTQIIAARPRSIGVVELESSFVVEFMQAPNEELQALMQEWVKITIKDLS